MLKKEAQVWEHPDPPKKISAAPALAIAVSGLIVFAVSGVGVIKIAVIIITAIWGPYAG